MGQNEETAAITLSQMIQSPILGKVVDLAGQVTDLKWDLKQLELRADAAIDSNNGLKREADAAQRRANTAEDRLRAVDLHAKELRTAKDGLANRCASQTDIIACVRALLDFKFENVGQLKLSLRANVGPTAAEEASEQQFAGYDDKGQAVFIPEDGGEPFPNGEPLSSLGDDTPL